MTIFLILTVFSLFAKYDVLRKHDMCNLLCTAKLSSFILVLLSRKFVPTLVDKNNAGIYKKKKLLHTNLFFIIITEMHVLALSLVYCVVSYF